MLNRLWIFDDKETKFRSILSVLKGSETIKKCCWDSWKNFNFFLFILKNELKFRKRLENVLKKQFFILMDYNIEKNSDKFKRYFEVLRRFKQNFYLVKISKTFKQNVDFDGLKKSIVFNFLGIRD